MICTDRWSRDVNWFSGLDVIVEVGGDDEQLERKGSPWRAGGDFI